MAVINFAEVFSSPEYIAKVEDAVAARMADGTLDGSLFAASAMGRAADAVAAEEWSKYSTQDLLDTFQATTQGTIQGQDPIEIQKVLAGRAGVDGVGWRGDSIRYRSEFRIGEVDPNLTPLQRQQIDDVRTYTQQGLQLVDDESSGGAKGAGAAMWPGSQSAAFKDVNTRSGLREGLEGLAEFGAGLAIPALGAVALGTGAWLGGTALTSLGVGAGATAGATAGTAGAASASGAVASAVPGFEALAGITATPLAAGGGAAATAGGAAGAGGGIMGGIKALATGGDVAGFTGKDILSGLGMGMDLYGAYQQGQAQDDAFQMMRQSAVLPGAGVTGPGGVGGVVGPGGGQMSLGDLDPIRSQIMQQLGGMAGNVPGEIPGAVNESANAFMQALSTTPSMNIQGLNRNLNMAQQVLGADRAGLAEARNPFQQALQDAAFGGATQHAQAAGGDFSGVEAGVLANLREQAAPHEQQQMNKLGEALFGSGRTGTTGGALQTEAMAKGLAQADLQRQLQAKGEARTQQTHAGQMAGTLTGVGGSTRQLQESLLDSAFSRFGQSMGLASDLEGQRFARQQARSDLAVERTGQGLTTQQQMAAFLPQLQQQFQAPLSAGLNQVSGLQTQALQPFQQALNVATTQGNLATGSATNIANTVNSANFDANPMMSQIANIFAQYANR